MFFLILIPAKYRTHIKCTDRFAKGIGYQMISNSTYWNILKNFNLK
jgi:hypothetical protein